jgi:hypothetical protein
MLNVRAPRRRGGTTRARAWKGLFCLLTGAVHALARQDTEETNTVPAVDGPDHPKLILSVFPLTLHAFHSVLTWKLLDYTLVMMDAKTSVTVWRARVSNRDA